MADDVTSNVLEHTAEFRAFVDGFDFKLVGKSGSLGKDIAVAAAQGIIDRTSADQKDATGGPLKPNAPAYLACKIKKHGVDRVGVLTGQMLSQESVLGTVDVTADEVVMGYGTGEKPTRYATGMGTVTGKEPSDIQKAEYFTEGGRPFYELDEAIAEQLYEVAAEALAEYLGNF